MRRCEIRLPSTCEPTAIPLQKSAHVDMVDPDPLLEFDAGVPDLNPDAGSAEAIAGASVNATRRAAAN